MGAERSLKICGVKFFAFLTGDFLTEFSVYKGIYKWGDQPDLAKNENVFLRTTRNGCYERQDSQ